MTDLTRSTIAQMRHGLAHKQFSALELTQAYLVAMDRARVLNAYVAETPERACESARLADTRIAQGQARSLEGIPIAVKDMFCTAGVVTTACSHILAGFIPTYKSTVTANLWRAGAVLLGKTNNDEFAMGSSNESSCYGPVVSPWRRRGSCVPLVPGGSSGGSAAAVAGCLAAGATGTDTGGSIRQPAAFTGIVGLKPTYGRCSRWGIVAFASSLDQAGPLARSVRDAAILLRFMAGPDDKDTTCADLPVPDYEQAIGRSIAGMRVGIPREYRLQGMSAEIEALWAKGAEWLAEAGAQITEISLPATASALPAYYILNPAEASSNLARYDGVRYGLRVPGSDVMEMYGRTRAARIRRRSPPPGHDRHLRALDRLL